MSRRIYEEMMGYGEEVNFSLWHRDVFEHTSTRKKLGNLSNQATSPVMKHILQKIDDQPGWEGTIKELTDSGFTRKEVATSIQEAFDLGFFGQITTTQTSEDGNQSLNIKQS